MDTAKKICLLIFRLPSAVCFSTARLSKIFQPAACFKLQPLPRQRVGMVLRREEKRREEKRREEKEATSSLKFLKPDFSENCTLHRCIG